MRVKDPRGFEIELTIKNIVFLLSTCTIQKNIIKNKLIYTFLSGQHFLMPTTCTEYKNAMKYTNTLFKKKTITNIKIGDIFSTKTIKEFIYLGNITIQPIALLMCSTITKDTSLTPQKKHLF